MEAGLVASLARPGGNLTGLSYGFSQGFHGKWIELLRECVPQLKTVAVMYNPQNPWAVQQRKNQEESVLALGLKAHFLEVTATTPLSGTITQARRNAQGLIVVADPLTYQLRQEVAILATRHRLPMMASMLEFAEAGALSSYGVDNVSVMRRMAEHIDRILRGTKPGDIPLCHCAGPVFGAESPLHAGQVMVASWSTTTSTSRCHAGQSRAHKVIEGSAEQRRCSVSSSLRSWTFARTVSRGRGDGQPSPPTRRGKTIDRVRHSREYSMR